MMRLKENAKEKNSAGSAVKGGITHDHSLTSVSIGAHAADLLAINLLLRDLASEFTELPLWEDLKATN